MGDVVRIKDYIENPRLARIFSLEDRISKAFYAEDLEKMVSLGVKLHKLDPNNALAFAAFAVREYLAENYGEAIGYASAALEFDFDNKEALLLKLDLVQELFDVKECCLDYTSVDYLMMQAFGAHPSDEDILERLINVSISIFNNRETAKFFYDRAMGLNPKRFNAYHTYLHPKNFLRVVEANQ
ncbi:hypothetical protein KY349_05610 [Candidatus Woesearchaeota archaeon]|nr:hypothetical protein [Candidatus Woesearchaeota archaeon]